ncbi:MAG: hypothetical protein A3C53_02430 [Omnitrophica WOR_2 bacterium RIFCSPHIGHO2_02_FULL_68_15]|nr:MAG: hypothetical protein A3C53_02430 [Omnitrophica WOR_2 bacterium RIFCSPHIGHO2_02_FULL_68_15]
MSYLVVALAVALAWGLRGVHGHERGGAIAGAMAGLAIAAVTGSPRWIGASVLGSMGFAIGGALSYGRFVGLAFHGAWHGIVSLVFVGVAWGGLGGMALGLGLALPQYRSWERLVIGLGLLGVWAVIEFPLSTRIEGLQDLLTRDLMILVLLGAWGLLAAYVGAWKHDRSSIRLALAGALGFGIGFPLAAWVQGLGQLTGLTVDWWKIAEHGIGAVGGLVLAMTACTLDPGWSPPIEVRPWERWAACAWLLWMIPAWALANDVTYWTQEHAVLTPAAGRQILQAAWVGLGAFALVGWLGIRRGRYFTVSWFPHQLRLLFLLFVWAVTLIAVLKMTVPGGWSPTPIIFLGLAAMITLLLPKPPHQWRTR